ncbi:sucrase ferredoxin [Janibacter corallicola]|uniref:sucrase ferredoxin n=1 Tax=Janibacter corallicola TaxID=415212 RepID=UPI00147014FC|nr:sucrase ferredoxin [Janibacter corallicola]
MGTAVPAPYWLLVGHPGPWPRKPIDAEPLTEVAGPLSKQLGRVGARLQLVRPHGRVEEAVREGRTPLPVFLVDVRRGLVGRSTWHSPEDLVELAGRFEDLPNPSEEPLFLVCTHGRKDVCCAISGRVVAAVLDDVLPGAVWETSHLGGDRFAGNVALLPEGSMYGRVDGDTAPRVVLDHLDGRVDLDRWRGRSSWHPAAQVVVHRLLGEDPRVRLADLPDPHVEVLADDVFRVTVQAPQGPFVRVVRRTMSEPHVLSCTGGPKAQALFAIEREQENTTTP